ncbi:MAG: hypothetical protein HOW73_07435 [Polyangiaceae bacterium]|nr:hypothetical protein [Polyangiaceae bacterium]
MPNHFGFAAIATINAATIQNLLRVLRRGPAIPVSLAGELQIISLGVRYEFFVGDPTVELRSGRDFALISLPLTGAIRETVNGETVEGTVQVNLRIAVAVRVDLSATGLSLNLDTANLNVIEVSATQNSGPPLRLPGLLSGAGRGIIQAELRSRLGNVIPPLAPDVFGPVLTAVSVIGLRIRVPREGEPAAMRVIMLDDALAIGLDLEGTASATPFRTIGDAAAVVDTTGGMSMSAAVHPQVLWAALTVTEGIIETQAWLNAGVRVDALRFELEPTSIHLTGNAQQGDLGGGFSLRIRPNVSGGRIGFELYDLQITALPWWVYVVSAIATAIFPAVVPPTVVSVVDSIEWNLQVQLQRTLSSVTAPGSVTFTLPDVPYPRVTFRTNRMLASSEGLFATSMITAGWAAASWIDGPGSVSVESLGPVRYQLRFAERLILPRDTSVRVRWTLLESRSGATLAVQDRGGLEPGATELPFDVSNPAWRTFTSYRIQCRVYRPVLSQTEELFQEEKTLTVSDRLDRGRPFVRWRHSVYVPNVRVSYDQGRRVDQILGYDSVVRQSKIHRTAYPGRCRFATQYSSHVRFDGTPDRPMLEYLDTLPFPVEELPQNRRQVCDYCFFGGPDKNVPRI